MTRIITSLLSLLLITLMGLLSCQESAPEGPANYELVIVDSIRVDRYGTDYLIDVDVEGERLMLANRFKDPRIIIANFDGEVLHEFPIEKDGPNAMGNLVNATFMGSDSLFMMATFTEPLFLSNDGKVLSRFELPYKPSVSSTGPYKTIHATSENAIVKLEGRDSKSSNPTIFEFINWKTSKVTPVIPFPEVSSLYEMRQYFARDVASARLKDEFYISSWYEPAIYRYSIADDTVLFESHASFQFEDFEAVDINNFNENIRPGTIDEILVDDTNIYLSYNSGIAEQVSRDNKINEKPMSYQNFLRNYLLILDKDLKQLAPKVSIPKEVRSLKKPYR